MKHIYYWVLISLGVGILAGIITSITNRRGKSEGSANSSESDLDEIEGSHSSNIIFVILVFSVLAFIVIWLATAISGRNVFE